MNVLLAGATGLLGAALRRAAPAHVALATPPRAELDIADAAAVAAAVGRYRPQVIINAAGHAAVDAAEADRNGAFRANCEGPAQLAAAAAQSGCRLVQISSDYVFDGRAAHPYLPTDAPAPLSVYGAAKAAGEAAVADRLPGALIMRTAWLYGADGDSFVQRLLCRLEQDETVKVVADQTGTPTHAAAAARAVWALVETDATGIHHYTDAGSASWYSFAVAIQDEALRVGRLATRRPIAAIRSIELAAPAARPAYSVLDCTATYARIGAVAQPWRAALRAAFDEGTFAHG